MDQNSFMEALLGLADYAQGNGNVLTKAQVEESFDGMDLSEAQYDLIYRYLFEKKITIQGIRIEPMEHTGEDAGKDGRKKAEGGSARTAGNTDNGEEDSRYLRVYLKEIEPFRQVKQAERLALAMRLLDGEEAVFDELLHASLHEVVEVAKGYRGRGVHVEDLIQEGNIALMQVLRELTGKKSQAEPLAYIREYVRLAIAEHIDGQTAYGDEQERIVAKLGLLHEAAKHMAKENGVLPDAQELADYTKLAVEEVKELVRLSKDVDFLRE